MVPDNNSRPVRAGGNPLMAVMKSCDRCPRDLHTNPCQCGCLGRQHWYDDANLNDHAEYAAPSRRLRREGLTDGQR